MREKKFGALTSSTNPDSIANSVKGTVLMFAGVILFIAKYFNFPLTEAEIVDIAAQLGVLSGIIWTLYGLVLKLVVWVNSKF